MATTLTSEKLTTYINHLTTLIRTHPNLTLTTTAAAALLSVTPWLYNNYKAFLAIGPGGLPYNVFGWLIALGLKPFSKETRSVDQYVKDGNKDRWLREEEGELKARKGGRPKLTWHVAPIRQLDGLGPEDISIKLDALFADLVASNPELVQFAPSPHERLHKGIVLNPSLPSPHQVASNALREVAHIHPVDHSMHVVLAPLDCKLLIEKGWGERHPLSGVSFVKRVPKEYVGIYSPRDEEELEVVKRLVKASIGYMTGRKLEDIKG